MKTIDRPRINREAFAAFRTVWMEDMSYEDLKDYVRQLMVLRTELDDESKRLSRRIKKVKRKAFYLQKEKERAFNIEDLVRDVATYNGRQYDVHDESRSYLGHPRKSQRGSPLQPASHTNGDEKGKDLGDDNRPANG